MQETQVQSLGGEDPLEKEMATHSSILAWEIPGTEEPGGLQSMGWQKSQTRLRNNNSHHFIMLCSFLWPNGVSQRSVSTHPPISSLPALPPYPTPRWTPCPMQQLLIRCLLYTDTPSPHSSIHYHVDSFLSSLFHSFGWHISLYASTIL